MSTFLLTDQYDSQNVTGEIMREQTSWFRLCARDVITGYCIEQSCNIRLQISGKINHSLKYIKKPYIMFQFSANFQYNTRHELVDFISGIINSICYSY